MTTIDFFSITTFWFVLLIIGLSTLPVATKLFSNFLDRGYIFSKILGLAILSYVIWLFGSLKILPFSQISSLLILLIIAGVNISLMRKSIKEFFNKITNHWKIMAFEEGLFLLAFVFWSYIRAHEPSIHSLEKFMDFGFVSSILRSEFFPPRDLWFTPETINYYYFGHLVTAVLTKLSGIPAGITFNLMMAVLFALTFVGSFSIGLNLFRSNPRHKSLNSKQAKNSNSQIQDKESSKHLGFENLNLFRISDFGFRNLISGFLSAFLVTFGGNLHTIYAFTRGFDKYWYPDATRFIPYTIHEFPSYSWVVSDLHGHVLDIPFVLLTLALLSSLFINPLKKYPIPYALYPIPFILAVMYMTNAWDGIIYLGLATLVLFCLNLGIVNHNDSSQTQNSNVKTQIYNLKLKAFNFEFQFCALRFALCAFLLITGFFIFSLPFNIHFKPFASSLFLVKDHSPLYMLAILWGFFYFFVVSFLIFLYTKIKLAIRPDSGQFAVTQSDIFILIMIFISTLLLIFPEVAYVKDIYPLHYRANTMFKLGYQAFIMLSLSSVYIFMRIITSRKNLLTLLFFCTSVLLFIPVAIYPSFGIKSYYNDLKTYQGLNGMNWLKAQYPSDYEAINWLKQNIKGQPVILEAVGESYTDYARASVFSGLPTIVGWPVHEWLWRGSYDEPGKRDAEVRRAYETSSLEETKDFLQKYQVEYVFVGTLERQKYPRADFEKWGKLGTAAFQSGQTTIYQIP